MNRKRIVSGIRPTGSVHLGNYLGAIRSAVALQEEHQGFFFIADLHAITDSQDPRALAEHTLTTAALYLACGIDPQRASLFVQSHVAAHSQLARLLGSVTPVGLLKRMIQFKEKAVKQGQEASLGLLDYPVLMASDILLYDADLVPVGEDQKQHLELTRDIAARFNRIYGSAGKEVFHTPEPLLMPEGARVMSLTDGSKKMSKSDLADSSRINLLDSPDVIRAKVKRAKTDSISGLEFDNPQRPEAHNLLSIYQLVSGKTREAVAEECKEMGFGQFKALLAEAIVVHLAPIQERYRQIVEDKTYLLSVLRQGRLEAEAVADATLCRAKESMGFSPVL